MQRRHDRKVIFHSDANRSAYLAELSELRQQLGVQLFSYCLMSNHVHLIIQPSNAANMGLFMRAFANLAGHSTKQVRRSKGPSTPLAVPIDSNDQLLTCARYIELNPVEIKVVARPEDYRWSSYRSRIGLSPCSWLDTAPCFLTLGETVEEQRQRYREFVEGGIQDRLFRSPRTAQW